MPAAITIIIFMMNGQLIDEPRYMAVGPSAPPIIPTLMTYHLISYAYHQDFFLMGHSIIKYNFYPKYIILKTKRLCWFGLRLQNFTIENLQ